MKYTFIPYLDKPISQIIYGTANPCFMEGICADGFIDEILQTGITTFDTARVYGEAERTLGNWLKKKEKREGVVLISKCSHPSKNNKNRINEYEIKKDLEASLKALSTSYIDIYMLHRDNPESEVGDVIEIFNSLRASGKVRSFGVSNWTHQRIEKANEYAYKYNLIPVSVSSPHFSLADQVQDPWGSNCVTISGHDNVEAQSWYEMTQTPVIAYSSLAHGFLSGKFKSCEKEQIKLYLDKVGIKGYAYSVNYERLHRCEILAEKKGYSVAQIALAWSFSSKIKVIPVVTTQNIERLKEDLVALEMVLTEEELKWLLG